MLDVTDTPPRSLWAATAPQAPDLPELDGPREADLAVVGGGFTGLATAHFAQELGLKPVVIEAMEPGWGASGRNNGQVIPTLTRVEPDALVARFGGERGERMVALIRDSAQDLFDLVRKHGIACEASQAGWIQPAHSPGRTRISAARAEQWGRRGAPVELLDKKRVAEMLGSEAYHGGWMNRSGGSINPLALARGMAGALQRLGVPVFARSPATAIKRAGDRWRVETARGSVTASRVVLATAAYSDDLWPGLKRTIVPALAWQAATAPLGDNVRATVLPGRQAVSDTHGDLRFFRYDDQGRLVSGGALLMPINRAERMRAEVAGRLGAIFPQLDGVQVDFVWNGYLAMTPDYTPRLHQLADGVFSWIGCNGRGVALAIPIGRELAKAAAGARADDLAWPLTAPAPIPLHGLVARFSRPAMLWLYRRRDAREVA
ncbi:MAG: FAD-binding oxidoreductase [Alphaproteobacteria bacterium]|nr:FAD-binding oxidoreductase [Alphaproteobacteria bacterium]